MMEAGLSTWGNVPDYKSVEDQRSQAAIRALEDVNELVTMYLWHPEYFKTFLDYLQLRIPGFGEQEVRRDGLTPISQQDRVVLELGVQQYVEEMRARLGGS